MQQMRGQLQRHGSLSCHTGASQMFRRDRRHRKDGPPGVAVESKERGRARESRSPRTKTLQPQSPGAVPLLPTPPPLPLALPVATDSSENARLAKAIRKAAQQSGIALPSAIQELINKADDEMGRVCSETGAANSTSPSHSGKSLGPVHPGHARHFGKGCRSACRAHGAPAKGQGNLPRRPSSRSARTRWSTWRTSWRTTS